MSEPAQQPFVLADARWRGSHGIGRFATEVLARLPAVDLLTGGPPVLHPLDGVWVTALLLRRRPDAYFSPGFNPPPWSPVPLVFTIWDLIHLRFADESGPLKAAYYRAIVRPAARRAERVLTGSEFSKREIVDWAGVPQERVTVVGSGVAGEFTPEGPRHSPGYPYLLYVGNHKPHKNLPRLLAAFAASGLAPEVRLMLSGDPDAATRRAAEHLRLGDSVVLAGLIPDAALGDYYRGALAVALPSLYEGFGLPAVEAMASGVPVVASNATSLPEVVGDAAVTVDPHDVESIAIGLRRAVEDDSLRERCRKRGLVRAKAFTWERTADLTRRVLEDACRNGRGR